MLPTVRFSRVPTNGIALHVAESGPASGPLLILLHGFPEFWYGWRQQIGPLADAGFHVVAPDLRGYNLSDKPEGTAAYDLDSLSADVLGVAEHFGQPKFRVAGHDWGAAIAWWLASRRPERIERFAALNAPHPTVWLRAMREHPVQRRKSSYVRLFSLPYLPEFLLRIGKYKALASAFQSASRAGAFTDHDLEQYRSAWSQPGALTAMVHYYRAALQKTVEPEQERSILPPGLVLWGVRDAYAIPELAEFSVQLCAQARLVFLDQATHWIQHDEPDQVTRNLVEFFS